VAFCVNGVLQWRRNYHREHRELREVKIGCGVVVVMRIILSLVLLCVAAAGEEPAIRCIWLSYKSNDPSKVVVNWETEKPAMLASVQYGATEACEETKMALQGPKESTLHHIEIPVPARGKRCYYRAVADGQKSAVKSFLAMPEDTLRIAVVADWQDRKKLDALMKDEPHLLVADLVECLHKSCGVGVMNCTKPFSDLIRAYPDLFSSVPFMPALGNHDREIRPRAGKEPPPEAVYDVDATAWRLFFELPDQEWMWRLELPPFDLQVIALDLQHTSDMGTTYQSGHPFDLRSEQFKTYSRWMENLKTKFTVTILNEKSSTMRSKENGAWHKLFSRGTVAITGFGYFAERAEVMGFRITTRL